MDQTATSTSSSSTLISTRCLGRDGNNVTVTLPVAYDEAALGANVKVPTPDGSTVTLKIPQGTSNGPEVPREERAHLKGKTPGDLIVGHG